MLSRLLYTNPVCLLAIHNPRNVMVLTWLTPINNEGHFVCSINKNRSTAKHITTNKLRQFTLNVPVHGMEDLILSIGSSHQKETVDKFSLFNIKTCQPGWTDGDPSSPLISIADCVAHMVCNIDRIEPEIDPQHYILFCHISQGFVKSSYWTGKLFKPTNPTTPPYLTFFGSQKFGLVTESAPEST
uniref:Uncharacterized protein n=1 Tax=Arcella intermedia TaxID=1963864 RepID=A0A6B2LK87_9EUKA